MHGAHFPAPAIGEHLPHSCSLITYTTLRCLLGRGVIDAGAREGRLEAHSLLLPLVSIFRTAAP